MLTLRNKKLGYRRDSAGRRSLRRSRSLQVTDFGTNRKPACDFLLVNNTNLHPISRTVLWDIAHAVSIRLLLSTGGAYL